jgi:uncharacterized membrane protein
MSYEAWVVTAAHAVEIVGVVVLLAGAGLASTAFVRRLVRGAGFTPAYQSLRMDLGRAILLGLELLVAGDIIKTVAVAPTLQNMAVLGALVLIRTFLSFSLELEINGRWPWQQKTPAP